MSWIVWLSATVLFFLAFYQWLLAVLFSVLFRRWHPRPERVDRWPVVEVWMSLRGSDPELRQNLRGMLSQDYPDYQLRIVVDSEQDEAWTTVHSVTQAGQQNCRVETLRDRRTTCSLKCSAMSQLADGLDKMTEVVVLADGDIVAHPSWLKHLVEPMVDEQVGVSTGNRWYMPPTARLGTMIRYLWNVGAMVPTFLFANVWGGSCALRADLFRTTDLSERWRKAAVEDAPLKTILSEKKLRCRFVPGIMMINREDCTLSFAIRFITRMFTWSRLYEPGFVGTIIHALVCSGAIAVCLIALPMSWMEPKIPVTAAWIALVVYHLSLCLAAFHIESAVREAIRRNGTLIQEWVTGRKLLSAMIAGPILEMFYPWTVIRAWFQRRVMWRGIEYQLRGPYDVVMTSYQVLQHDTKTNESI
jgi:hypothetical protein